MPETFFPPNNKYTEVLVPRTSSVNTIFQATAHATPHTKGNYTEVVASTSADVSWVKLWVRNTSVNGSITSQLLDIAVGTAGNEVVKVANMSVGYIANTLNAGSNSTTGTWEFPLFIPSGSRIAVRNQAQITVDTVDVAMDLFYGGKFLQYSGAPLDTYGANTAASRGTDVPAGLSGAEGAWTQITSSTVQRHIGLLVSASGAGDVNVLAGDNLFDIGVGTAGNEVVIASDLVIASTSTELVYLSTVCNRIDGLNIPAGSALSVRLSSSQGSAQSLDFCLHGLS